MGRTSCFFRWRRLSKIIIIKIKAGSLIKPYVSSVNKKKIQRGGNIFVHDTANHGLTIKSLCFFLPLSRQCVRTISMKCQRADPTLNADWPGVRNVTNIPVDDWILVTAPKRRPSASGLCHLRTYGSVCLKSTRCCKIAN